ncbi:MAG TPA: DNA alkylation repair protein, partial [candidate division Zixibacteria bacterium]|nr:DNA alkylation repair protein [candidate division Zixibacteria bacterium]
RDDDYLVQKGYGWMLKEASQRFPRDIFRFVLERKDRMPRIALRYAIEKLPASQRSQAMKRD